MTKARDIADLLDANGDIVSSALDNVPPSNDASALTTGTIDNARISLDANEIPSLDTAKITTGTFADARMPSTVLNSNVDLTNLSATNLTSGTVPIARLGSSGTKDATTFLRGDNTFATVSSDYVNLTSATVSGSPSSVSIDGFFTSDYDIYVLKIYNFRQSAQTTPFYRFNVSGTPHSTASHYYTITGNWYGYGSSSSSTHDRYWGNQSEARLFNWDISNNSNEVSAWETIINNPLTAGDHNLVETRGVVNAQNMNTLAVFHAATQFRTGQAISGITVYAGASSNISELKYSLYGLKK